MGGTILNPGAADIVDAVEYDEQDAMDRSVAEGLIVTVPSASPQAVLNVAQQLNSVVLSIEDLTRFRTPLPVGSGERKACEARMSGA
ncbi:hypothetical protein ACFUNF_08450 [Streptomyces sp. NPDC057291]|uniref:hypothetical protein n=1 Tax=Streptomyces sp. NPDC057291 TaxID=3346087 RepID=UPI00363FF8BB